MPDNLVQEYVVTRDVTPGECRWLRETVTAGTVVQRFWGVTYGVIGNGIAVSRDGGYPFFEMPRDALAAR